MKHTISLCLAFVMSLLMTISVSAKGLVLEYDGKTHNYTGSIYTLSVNGEEIKTPLEPIIFNDRALVPVREVFESTGAEVLYDSKDKSIIITGDEIELAMCIGDSEVVVNGKKEIFPDGVSPKLIAKKGESAKTMVPVRFISETLGYTVNFSGSSIDIITEEETKEDEKENQDENVVDPILIQSLYCKKSGDTVMISVKCDSEIETVPKTILTSSNVLYFDIPNSQSKLPSKTEVGRGAVTRVRTGLHEEYTRIAIDVENLKNYSVKLSKDKKTIMVTTVKKADNTKEKEKIVVIDPGHGGSDGGAVTELDGEVIKEKDINLSVAKKVVNILKSNGITVQMTRTGDTFPELPERSAFANSIEAAMFVSVHSNSVENAPEANGIEVYYAGENNSDDYGVRSQELAGEILDTLIKNTKANNRKVKKASHLVTRTCDMPAVLIELGFITNEVELKNMVDDEYQDKLALGIAQGIMECLPDISIPDGENETFDETDLGDKIA